MILTVEELKSYLGITVATYDAVLEDLEIEAASIVERITGWKWSEPTTDVHVLIGQDTDEMFLPERPSSQDPTDFVIDDRLFEADPNEVTIDPAAEDGYVIDGRRIRRKGGNCWLSTHEYVVTGPLGWLPADVPGYIRAAVRALVNFFFGQLGKEGLKSEAIGGYSYTLSDTSDDDIFGIPAVRVLRTKARKRI